MGFKEKYTTKEKVEKDESLDKVESKKTVLTPEGYAQGELLELLINTLRNK
jgi:hypothetical protein